MLFVSLFIFSIGWMCWFKTPKLSHPVDGPWSNWCVQTPDRPSITLHVSILYEWASYKRRVTTTDLNWRFRNQHHFPSGMGFKFGYSGFCDQNNCDSSGAYITCINFGLSVKINMNKEPQSSWDEHRHLSEDCGCFLFVFVSQRCQFSGNFWKSRFFTKSKNLRMF